MHGNMDSTDQDGDHLDEELVLSSDVDWDAIALVLETCANDEAAVPLPSWAQVPSCATPNAECNPHELETAAPGDCDAGAPSLGPSVFPIEEEGGRRKKQRSKSPGAPKKPSSAYIFFYKEARPLVKARLGPNANATDIMRAVGEDWKAATSDVRARCEAKAAAEKEKYYRELAEYSAAPTESTGESHVAHNIYCQTADLDTSPRPERDKAPLNVILGNVLEIRRSAQTQPVGFLDLRRQREAQGCQDVSSSDEQQRGTADLGAAVAQLV